MIDSPYDRTQDLRLIFIHFVMFQTSSAEIQQISHTDLGSQLNLLFSVFRDTIAIGKKHAFLNARPHHFRTSTLVAISNASERLKSACFGKNNDDSDSVIKLKRKTSINQNSTSGTDFSQYNPMIFYSQLGISNQWKGSSQSTINQW